MHDVIAERLRVLGGAARYSALGVQPGDHALRVALASGSVHRPVRGVYALPGTPTAVVTAVLHRAAVGCVSAAKLAGLYVLDDPKQPHLSVPRDRGVTASRARSSFPAVLHREAWQRAGSTPGPAIVPIDDALARMLVCRSPAQALVTIDHALNKGITTAERLRAALPRTAPTDARRVLTLADGRSMSPLETVTRLALRAAGMTVGVGVEITGVGHVDLVVEGAVVVELDGYEFHSGLREFREDRRRDRELVALGYRVLRFTAYEVWNHIDVVVATVRRALARAAA